MKFTMKKYFNNKNSKALNKSLKKSKVNFKQVIPQKNKALKKKKAQEKANSLKKWGKLAKLICT